MKGMRLGLSICLGCRVCVRGMSAARCICLDQATDPTYTDRKIVHGCLLQNSLPNFV